MSDGFVSRSKASILLFTGNYIPGYKGGGPIRTIFNLVGNISDVFDFSLVTSDRDLGDKEKYDSVRSNSWSQVGSARVYYMKPRSFLALAREVERFRGDILYLNSFFSFRFSIFPLLVWIFLRKKGPVVLAPRGEFSRGALSLKSFKKRAFLLLSRLAGFHEIVTWHASSFHEEEDIRRVMGAQVRIRTAINIASPQEFLTLSSRNFGGPLRIVFMSRLTRMKNLIGALRIVEKITPAIIFDIYGPLEDRLYWEECESVIRKLPDNVCVNYLGALTPAEVPSRLAGYDLFLMPTLGENFGHAIAEALSSGLPVLISDRTPWRDLSQKKLGWDIPLDQPEQFVAAIESCSRMPAVDYDAWRQSIRAWALKNIGNEEAVEQNRQLFMNLDSPHEH